MRYARVEQVLSQELAFRDRLSPKSEAVLKPDGESQLFAPEVIAITQLIHKDGKDAHKCQKLDVIRAAVDVFNKPKAAPAPPPEPAPPAPPEPTPPAAKKPAVVKAEKPTPAPKSAPKPKAKAAPAKAPQALDQVKETQKSETTSEKTPDVKPDAKREEVLKAAKEALTEDTSQTTVNPYISMYSLVITALQNCELFDDQPGKDKRLKTLDELANEFCRLTKSYKGAKETQKA
jgi:hypothetical protein